MRFAKKLVWRALILCFLVPVLGLGKLQSIAMSFTSHRPVKGNSHISGSRGILRESLSSFADTIANFFYAEDAPVQTQPSRRGNNRLLNEIASFIRDPPHNTRLEVGRDVRRWTVHITGIEGTPYAGETYSLRLLFPSDYPMRPPIAYFVNHVPRHEHIYSNGDICLSLLGNDWQPTLSAETIVVCIQSMLSSAKVKSLPPDNAIHAQSPPGSNQDNFMYHDDRY